MAARPRIVSDESAYCDECTPEQACGHGHLYVVQLRNEAQGHFAKPSSKGVLYVGSTGKGVFERFLDNFRLDNGELIEPGRVLANPEAWKDAAWRYTAPSTKRIRRHYWRHRPDLIVRHGNPIVRDLADPGKLERWEKNLADCLRNRGWRVFGPSRK